MCPPDVFILYLRCTETPCIARRARRPVSEQHLQVSALPHLALAVAARRFRHTQQTPLPLPPPSHYIIQDYLLPSLNVGAAITTPPSHHRQLYPGCPRCCTCHCTRF